MINNPTTIIGTTNQVLVNGTTGVLKTGSLTLTLPQNINTGATPVFDGTNFSNIPNTALVNDSISVVGGTGLGVSGSPVALGGTVTLSNTGVTSITAGPGVSISGSTGNVTIENTSITSGSSYVGKSYSVTVPTTSGTTVFSSTATPTITTGFQIATLTVTPMSTSSRFILDCSIWADCSSNNRNVGMAIFRGNVLVTVQMITVTTSGRPGTIRAFVIDSPATTSPITYSVRFGMDNTGTAYVNSASTGINVGATQTAFGVTELQ